ncbi:MAG: hypothetical protein RIS90_2112 [Pseudomonadota bacterium]|jgi:polyhydroxyalkanoate synthase
MAVAPRDGTLVTLNPAPTRRQKEEDLMWTEPARPAELATQALDRLIHAASVPQQAGLSPISLALAQADWSWHLLGSPGKQLELLSLAAQLAHQAERPGEATPPAGPSDEDPRFRDDAWTRWPFNQWRQGFRQSQAFWREATQVAGMTSHHRDLTQFFARQWLDMMAPPNWLATNPVVWRDIFESNGTGLAQGVRNWLQDVAGTHASQAAEHFRVGREVAITPGKVVYRNRLIELLRYDAQTTTVHAEPILIVPSWIMKYYILDLSPGNSLVRYLVGQGHRVYMLSWRNPDASDRDLSMDDYLRLGVLEALRAVANFHPEGSAVHTAGYCLGGTLLAIAVAALARPGGVVGSRDLPKIRSVTLLAAQTDFSEPGELGLLIDESQICFLDNLTRGQGYLTGRQMAASFQFLHSRELVWTRRMREYLLGEREPESDLTAWNADHTRMPARMHHEYLTSLYLNNALANSAYRVEGRAVALADVRAPMFVVGTLRDHISPWRSVYQLHRLCDPEITFVLTSGGHNAGIVSEPGHAHRHYQINTRPAHGSWTDPDQWQAQTAVQDGSWWPEWQHWLVSQSTGRQKALPFPDRLALGDAPGDYVRQRYPD